MAKQNINSKKGFTIIEVVLVLAIAGLIFLMVFVALPALQRSQRDTARRNDMSRVDTSLVQYQTNNQSASTQYPASGVFNGKTEPGPFKEEDPVSCVTNYGNQKIEVEHFGESLNKDGGRALNCPIFKRIVGDEER